MAREVYSSPLFYATIVQVQPAESYGGVPKWLLRETQIYGRHPSPRLRFRQELRGNANSINEAVPKCLLRETQINWTAPVPFSLVAEV